MASEVTVLRMSDDALTAAGRRFVQHNAADDGFVTRRVAGETIIVPVSSRVGDLDAIYTLNEVASRIWTLLESPRSVEEIVSILCDEYDAPRDEVARDVIEIVDELQGASLVQARDDSKA